MTRVLALTLYYPPHHFGGYELSCRDVLDRLAGRGHDVAVLTSDLRLPAVEDDHDTRVDVRRELVAWLRDHELYHPSPLARWRIERANHKALATALRDHRPEVVTVWHMGAMSLGLIEQLVRVGMPLVYVIGDDWLCYAPELDSWSRMFRRLRGAARLVEPVIRMPVQLRALGNAAVLFNSEDNRRRAHGCSNWPIGREAVVYTGFDGEVFTANSAPGFAEWRGRLLFAGRYDPRKGLATVIEALTNLPGHTLEVRGTGDAAEQNRLAALARRLGVDQQVEFADPLPSAALADRYRQADAVVFPSIWDEPFGLVPIEAMACGTPVIGTGRGGSGEFLLDDVNYVRFPAGEASSLASAVRRLAADPALRDRLVVAGRRTAAFFDVEHLANAVNDWIAAAARSFAEPLPQSRKFDAAIAQYGPE